MSTAALERQPHPAPHRERLSLPGVWFAIIAGPLVWSLQLMLNAGIVAHGCFPHTDPLAAPIWRALSTATGWIEVIAIIVCIIAFGVAWGAWRRTREERPGSAHHLIEGGDGRSRFMAMTGLLSSTLFLIAVLFSLAGLLILPVCGA